MTATARRARPGDAGHSATMWAVMQEMRAAQQAARTGDESAFDRLDQLDTEIERHGLAAAERREAQAERDLVLDAWHDAVDPVEPPASSLPARRATETESPPPPCERRADDLTAAASAPPAAPTGRSSTVGDRRRHHALP